MEMNIYPTNLEEAVETIEAFWGEDKLDEVKKLTEGDFVTGAHFGASMWFRNEWCLWWNKEKADKIDNWPKEKPALVAWFHNLGIWHADDMSSIIMTSLYRKVKGLPWELEEQVQSYLDHWKKHGVDGTKFTE